MEPTTRAATLDDAAAIQRLNRDDLGYDHPLESVTEALTEALSSPRDRVLVAELDGEVVGYVHGEEYRLLYERPMVNVLGIAVSDTARQRGAGRALLTELEAWAHSRGAHALRLVSGDTRPGAHAFYGRLGFAPVKTQVNFRKPLERGGIP
ncbi:MAG TPA: GNAT family N-acetyltransferase [Propionibacterium sp.]|nr:GNAT family N-acetyltransferase [Propionibacterium sp.]